MRPSFFTSFLVLLPLASTSIARVISITAPTNVGAGEAFNLIFKTQTYIQNWSDEFAIVGARLSTFSECDGCLGTIIGKFDLYTQGYENTITGNFSESITIQSPGSYNIIAAVASVAGASQEADMNFYTTTVQVN
ncbi:hypothetical protein FRB95_010210 [Tulasnella sp. JGI-2019a]|nr:hypothetical protein FRB93_008232 [Tulasnella sp. JGI-2019a]KAG9025414.1 hypothetical protein FRB95_010210 [Tulasnella sp. JGI-2019a]